jgi:hypothetical protein
MMGQELSRLAYLVNVSCLAACSGGCEGKSNDHDSFNSPLPQIQHLAISLAPLLSAVPPDRPSSTFHGATQRDATIPTWTPSSQPNLADHLD